MQRNANVLKILKKVRFCRFYWFHCKNAVPSLSPEKKFVPQGDFALNCILDSYKDSLFYLWCKKIFCIEK